MRRARLVVRLVAGLAAASSLVACATEVRTQVPTRDELGRVRPFEDPPPGLGQIDAWQWTVDTQSLEGSLVGPAESVGGVLRVATTTNPGFAGTADAHQLVQAQPSALPVGRVRWPAP